MKRISIFFLLTSLFFTSCSKDEPSPDLTTDFIGTWKSEVYEDQYAKAWSIWNITKVSNNAVKITSTYQVESKIEFYDSFESVDIIDKIELTDNRTMSLKMTQTDEDGEYSVDGTGVITGKQLSIVGKSTHKKTGEVQTINETLTKQ